MATFVKDHYEYISIACAFLLLFVNVGFTSTSFSVYQSYIVDLPGFGNIGGSTVISIRTCVAFICMFFTGIAYQRINPRIVFGAATLCTVMAFLIFSFWQTLTGFCVGCVLSGIGYGFGGMVAATYLVGRWFNGNVGTVSGIVAMGSGFASIIVPVVASTLINTFSLTVAFLVEAIVAALIAMFIYTFVRVEPEEVGRLPIQDFGRSADKPKKNLVKSADGTLRERVQLSSVDLPKSALVLMIVAIALVGCVCVAGYNYFGILMTSEGIEPQTAALLISVSGISLTIFKFLMGRVCDRIGTFGGTAIFFTILAAAFAISLFIGSGGVPDAITAAILIGAGMAIGTTGVSLWSLELSSKEQMLKTIRYFQLAYAFGGFAFNMTPGVLAQATGTYATSYLVMLVLTVVSATIILLVYSRHIARVRQALGVTRLHHRN